MDKRQPNEKRPSEHKRAQPTPWYAWPFVALKHLLFIAASLIVIEWSGVLGEVGSHAHQRLIEQLESLLQSVNVSDSLVQSITQLLMEGIPYLILDFEGVTQWLQPYWEGMVYVLLALGLRILMLVASYPLFLLTLVLALLDGLVVRQQRIARVARETETVHYYAKQLLPWVVMLGGYVWLWLPGVTSVPVRWVLVLNIVLCGCVVQKTMASYKKFF